MSSLSQTPPADDERLARLRLIRSGGIGPLTYRQLVEREGSAKAAIEALPGLIEASGRKTIRIANEGDAARELDALEKKGGRLLTLGEKDYPQPLAAIPDAPAVLSLFGDPSLLARDQIAIVGARNASAAGRSLARSLAEELGKAGIAVTSGMARGIDGAAHEAALDSGTIAVLAGGADNIYPPEHRDLYRKIADGGLIVSEQPLGMTAKARDFPKRNRIVSGLSLGVVVVEAAERSGTLITARLASEQGRDVFAVPGSPLDPRSKGTNNLLRKGAILVTSVSDILDELDRQRTPRLFEGLRPAWSAPMADTESEPDDLEATLESLLSQVPTHRDVLIAESGGAPSQVAAVLLDLVLGGRAAEDTGGHYVRAFPERGM